MCMSINVFLLMLLIFIKILTVILFVSYSVQYCLHYHTCSKRFTTDNFYVITESNLNVTCIQVSLNLCM